MLQLISRRLATAFVGGRWNTEELVDRGAAALGQRWRWLSTLAKRLVVAFEQQPRPSTSAVEAFLLRDRGLQRACQRHEIRLAVMPAKRAEMVPATGTPASWIVPPLRTVGELAEWLEIDTAELDWFADRRGLESKLPEGPLRHYRYYWLSKRLAGTARLIEAPKWRLKTIQRRLLHGILDTIGPHDTACGFRRGSSIHRFVAPHAGRRLVLKIDLRDFFPSINRARITAVFRVAGYPEQVAQTLAALCTNAVPADVWRGFPGYGDQRDQWRHESLYCRPHLPQGAPTSPALANLCAYRLDCRLQGLAQVTGAQYSRYADDLLFSGGVEFERCVRRFYVQVCAIALDEGFRGNGRKTRIMRQGVRQQAAGIVLNRHPNLRRDEFDRLKAILYNCARHGAASQNRSEHADFRAHLLGRVTFAEAVNAARGRRLRQLFERIQWPPANL
jgi:RNA-directed DNA polymerase